MRVAYLSIAVWLCVAAFPSLARAQDDAFKQGLQARGDKKWADVARLMRSAIQSDAQESTRKVRSNVVARLFGAQGMEYLPHYFLGEALKNQQDCAGAVTEWSTSEQQAAVLSRPDFVAVIKRGYLECAGKGVLPPNEFNPLLASTRETYVDVNALAKRIVDAGSAHPDIWPSLAAQYDRAHRELETAAARLTSAMRSRSASDLNEATAASERATAFLRPLEASLTAAIDKVASTQQRIRDVEQTLAAAEDTDKTIDTVKATLGDALTASRKSARDQVSQARERLTMGQKTQNASTVAEALKYAQSAAGTFTQVLEQARRLARGAFEQQFGESVNAADQAFASVSALIGMLDRRTQQKPDAATPAVVDQLEALRKRIDAQRRRFDRVRTSEDLAGVADVVKQARDAEVSLNALLQEIGPLTLRERGVSSALEQAARSFLNGDYQATLAALDPSAAAGEGPLQLQVHLFRAASLYGLFVRSGEARKDLHASAVAEIELCKRISSSFEPDPRVFAPRFIALYKTPAAVSSQAAATTR
jgi:hypothetical protein